MNIVAIQPSGLFSANSVMPTKAGIQHGEQDNRVKEDWIPAYAGMTQETFGVMMRAERRGTIRSAA